MRAFLTACFAAVPVVAALGCVEHTRPSAPPQQLTKAQENFQAVWDASCAVLRRYHFALDRQDRWDGVITTMPLVGRHWFEFWQRDAAANKDLAESTLQTVYRTVEVTIRPTAAGADTYKATVQVTVSRSDKPEAQITSTSEAYDLFRVSGTDEHGGMKLRLDYWRGGEGEQKGKSSWLVPLGKDADLEAKITADIQIEAAKRRAIHK